MKQYIIIPILEDKVSQFGKKLFNNINYIPDNVTYSTIQNISHYLIGEVIIDNSVKVLDVKFNTYKEANEYIISNQVRESIKKNYPEGMAVAFYKFLRKSKE